MWQLLLIKQSLAKGQIVWSEDELKAALLIKSYCDAVFDFLHRPGYCRNRFPGSNGAWTQVEERKLTDELIDDQFKE